jgi:spermidine synthase
MFLYRAIALRHQPLPLVFSTVLAGFLLFWSLGTLVSSLRTVTIRLTYVIFLCILSELGALLLYAYGSGPLPLNTPWNGLVFILTEFPYFLPCFFFGMLFGVVLQNAISLWGRDVARLSVWNTAGSCSGIVLATFVGYELNLLWMTATQWFLLLALGGVSDKVRNSQSFRVPPSGRCPTAVFWLSNVPALFFGFLVVLLISSGFVTRPSPAEDGSISLFGRDGVIMIDAHRNLVWDGLWHSRLSNNNDHVGTYNWALAVDPILAHPTGSVREALVVGMGSGITAATLAKHERIENIDVYDINQTLKEVLRLYPEGTLHVAKNPKIRMIWQDGRSGLALREKKYDLITQQPLYLKQAGASILLSKEYFKLVSHRLKENGVFCVYANGSPEQALAVRQTGSEVFPYMLVLHEGCSLIFANGRLELSQVRLEALLRQQGRLWEEIRNFRKTIGEDQWVRYIENCQLALATSKVTIRDDFPIVEYPVQLRRRLDSIGFTAVLPKPGLFLSLH